MSKSPFPCGLRRETLRSSYGFMGTVASTILFNTAQWQIWKNRKPVAVTSYDLRRGTARWSWGQRTILDCHFGPKMIVDSCDSRKEHRTLKFECMNVLQNVFYWKGMANVLTRLGGRKRSLVSTFVVRMQRLHFCLCRRFHVLLAVQCSLMINLNKTI